ncbi:helix-turn-helix domain-containing protein [Streptantibioticus rubrisoli]
MIPTRRAADIAGVSVEWVRRLAASGKIRGHQTDRNTWRVHLGDVRAYRDGRTRKGGTGGGEDRAQPGRQAHPGAA